MKQVTKELLNGIRIISWGLVLSILLSMYNLSENLYIDYSNYVDNSSIKSNCVIFFFL